MEYLLLDTCSLRNLFDEKAIENKEIDFLYQLVKAEKLKIITNSILQEEWSRHKEKQKQSMIDSLKTKERHAHEISPFLGINISELKELEFDWIDHQIASLDEIFKEYSIFIDITDKVKIKSTDHQVNKKAPFHNKFDGINDALIVFSTLNYFDGRDEKIIFISDNFTDFSKEKPKVNEIHPDIIEDYKNLHIEYYHNTGLGLSKLKMKFPYFLPKKSGQIELSSNSLKLNKNIPYEINLLNFIKHAYQNFNYIPLHILIDNEVFKDSTSKKYSYYENFALRSNREELIDLFKNAEFKNGAFKFNNCDLSIEESNQIINVLRRNCIYNITDGNRENYFKLPASNRNCDCISCSLKKFNLVRVLKLLKDLESDSLQDLTYKGYFLFQVGRLKSSLKLFKKILEKSTQDGNSVFANIAKYNLNKLYLLIPFINNKGAESSFDLLHEYSPINNTLEDKTIKWLIADDFLIDAQFQINDLKSKLISVYESVNNGGGARNSIILSVHNKFLRYSQFLVLNNIIYDNFIEDSQIKSDFVECLVCAIGIGEKNSGLRGWNDYTIQLVIENAEYKELLRALRRYNLQSIQHIEDKDQAQFNLKELYANLFSQQTDLFENLNKEESTYLIRGKLNRLYANAIILLAYLELKAQEFNSLLSLILECLSRKNLVDKQSIKYLATIISKKESLISKSNTQKLFKSILRYPQLHEREIIGTSFKLFAEKPENINASRNDFKKLKSQFFGECELCSKGHDEMDIINIWCFAEDYRTEISELILEDIESNNNTELEYLALAIPEEIIPFNHNVIKKLIAATIQFSKPRANEFFGLPRRSNFHFLQLMHLVYKFKISTKTKEFNKLKGLGDYYVWLLEPEKFDYSKFKVEWLFDIEIHEILDSLKEIKLLKEILSRELEDNPSHKQLLLSFIRLYKDRKEQLD